MSAGHVLATGLILAESKKRGALSLADRMFIAGTAELLRAAFCMAWIVLFEKDKRVEYRREYLLLGGLSSYHSFAWLFGSQEVSAVMLQILGQSKTFFVFVLSVAALGRRYTRTQWVSQAVLLGGLVFPVLVESYHKGKFAKEEGGGGEQMMYSVLVVSGCLAGAFSGVYFEKTVKRKVKSPWKNALNYSISSAGASYAVMLYSMGVDGKAPAMSLRPVGSLVLLKTTEGLLSAYIVIRYSTLAKALIVVFSTCVLSIPLSLYFGEKVSADKWISLAVVITALGMFNYPA